MHTGIQDDEKADKLTKKGGNLPHFENPVLYIVVDWLMCLFFNRQMFGDFYMPLYEVASPPHKNDFCTLRITSWIYTSPHFAW